MVLRRLKYVYERYEIVAIIHERLCNRFTYSLECCKMYDCIYATLCEESVNGSIVAAINLIERNIVTTCDLLYALKACHVTIGHIVSDYDLIARSDKLDSDMAADIAGTAGNKNSLCHFDEF